MTQTGKLRPRGQTQGKWGRLRGPFAGPVCGSGAPHPHQPPPHGASGLRRQREQQSPDRLPWRPEGHPRERRECTLPPHLPGQSWWEQGWKRRAPKLDICISNTRIRKTNNSNYAICIFCG